VVGLCIKGGKPGKGGQKVSLNNRGRIISLWARVVAKILATVGTKFLAHRFLHSTESYVSMYVANTKGAKWREITPWDFLIGLNHGVCPGFPIVQCQVIVMHNI